MQKLILIISTCSILSACEEAVQSKSFYVENDAARKAKLAWCADRPDVEYSSGNCLNANEALIQLKKEVKAAVRKELEAAKKPFIESPDYVNAENNNVHIICKQDGTYVACRNALYRKRSAVSEKIHSLEQEYEDIQDIRLKTLE